MSLSEFARRGLDGLLFCVVWPIVIGERFPKTSAWLIFTLQVGWLAVLLSFGPQRFDDVAEPRGLIRTAWCIKIILGSVAKMVTFGAIGFGVAIFALKQVMDSFMRLTDSASQQ